MKLKLDLHPIFNDSRSIEQALQEIIEEAVSKRASEVEIIPGKGSGALKKSVLRFLDRPEIKARYHRMEKDGDNWGRLFVHFRHERPDPTDTPRAAPAGPPLLAACACCNEEMAVPRPYDDFLPTLKVTCKWCGSPNRLTLRRDRRGQLHARAELDYDTEESDTQ